jgi:REP element-mobilizing transposase RayT
VEVVMHRDALQLELRIVTHGGKRRGAGAKRKGPRACVEHEPREPFQPEHPLHVTLRVRDGLPSLRERSAWVVIVRVLRALRERSGIRVITYAVLTNHIHLVMEGDDHDAFVAGMRALTTRLAMQLNRVFARRGRLLADRYHARPLATPREVRNALAYVLLNSRKHAVENGRTADWIDPRSSGAIFDGWLDPPERALERCDFGTSPARTWLLREGWRVHGLLEIAETPGDQRKRRASHSVAKRRPTACGG